MDAVIVVLAANVDRTRKSKFFLIFVSEANVASITEGYSERSEPNEVR